MAIKQILEYELASTIDYLKKLDLWMYVCAFVVLIALIARNYTLAAIAIVLMILLQMKRDYDSGEVINYIRRKRGFPSPAQIEKYKELKEQKYQKQQEQFRQSHQFPS